MWQDFTYGKIIWENFLNLFVENSSLTCDYTNVSYLYFEVGDFL